MTKTDRLNPGGAPEGRIEWKSILPFADTPAVPESGKAEYQIRKRKSIMKAIIITVVGLFLSHLVVYGQDKGPQSRIVLEEEEITLFDGNGKEIEKRYVSNLGESKKKILNQVKMQVHNKLKVKTEQEVQSKQLWKKAKEETEKLIKIKELKNPKLKFFGPDGAIVKELMLDNEVKRHRTPSKETKELIEVSSENIQVAILPETANVVGIIEMNTVTAFDSRIASTMTFEYLNAEGDVLWIVKEIKPWVNSAPRRGALFSSDGKRVALAIAHLPDNADMELYPNWVVVYDGAGKELVRFGPYDQLRNLYLSKNGRYGYFATGNSSVCFSVDDKNLHEFPQERVKRELNGVIRVSETGRCTINRVVLPTEINEDGEPKTKVVREFSFKE